MPATHGQRELYCAATRATESRVPVPRRTLIESIRIPPGREVTSIEARQAFEEIRLGLAAQAAGVLSPEPGAG
jgi:hypothetical protein